MSDDSLLGRFVWHELLTSDPEAATRFYTELIGWGTAQREGGSEPYTMWTNGDTPIGGVISLPEVAKQAVRHLTGWPTWELRMWKPPFRRSRSWEGMCWWHRPRSPPWGTLPCFRTRRKPHLRSSIRPSRRRDMQVRPKQVSSRGTSWQQLTMRRPLSSTMRSLAGRRPKAWIWVRWESIRCMVGRA